MFLSVDYYWINLSDNLEEGTWIWNDTGREADYTNWAYDQPNNRDGNEHYGVFKDLYWYDVPCESRYRLICEIP